VLYWCTLLSKELSAPDDAQPIELARCELILLRHPSVAVSAMRARPRPTAEKTPAFVKLQKFVIGGYVDA